MPDVVGTVLMWKIPLVGLMAMCLYGAALFMMIMGFVLSWREQSQKAQVGELLEQTRAAVAQATQTVRLHQQNAQLAAPAHQQLVNTLDQTAGVINALAALAKNLKGLTPAIASFLVATVIFFMATALALADRLAR